jgi:hypothetical protein
MPSAVSLYQKSGAVTKALNLCFRAKLFDDLRQIADSIGQLGKWWGGGGVVVDHR